ncbi:MAG: hypothetical protein PHT84_04865, partial [Candidatus Pacebacteria bacterium]|nr:hypothetical protein [Candidatus Paceibacterota bacterium]
MYIYGFYLVIILIHLFLVFLLIKKVQQNKPLSLLILFNLSVMVWVVLSGLLMHYYDADFVIWLVRFTFVSTTLAVVSFTVFIRHSIYRRFDSLTIAIILLAMPVIALSLSNYIVKDVDLSGSVQYVPVIFGDLAILFVVYFIFAVSGMLLSFWRKKGTIKGLESLRFKYVVMGMAIGGMFALVTNVIIPLITGKSDTAPLGPIAVSSISILTTYSYLENRLFGIKFLVSKIFYYILMTIIPFVFVYLSIMLRDLLKGTGDSFEYIVILLILSGLFAFLFIKVRESLSKYIFTSWSFKDFNPNSAQEQFNKDISVMLDMNKIGVHTVSTFAKMFDLDKVGIILFDKKLAMVRYRYIKGMDDRKFPMRDLLQVIYYWENFGHSSVLVRSELIALKYKDPRLERILQFMIVEGIEVILPLNRKVQLNGVILLGPKENGRPYTVEEISFLESLILNLSVSFGRALLYHEVEDFSRTLQKKVDEQTKELRIRMEHAEEMRQRERDLIDIMGHELRTPLTIAKNSIELIDMYKKSKKKKGVLKWDGNMQKQFEYIKSAIKREIAIVETLLSATKLDSKRMEVNLSEVDLVHVLETTRLGFEKEAIHKGLKFKIVYDKRKDWKVKADSIRIQQVIDNFTSNAVKYTSKGSVRVSLKEEGKRIAVVVTDTG